MGDSIIFYQDKKHPVPKILFVFPLSVNKEWMINECDNYKVLTIDTLSLPVGVTADVVNVEQIYSCEVEAGAVNNYYINPNIGVVKYRSNYMNAHYAMNRNTEWILKSYSINK